MSNRLFGPAGAPGAAGLLAAQTSGAAAPALPALQVVTTSATDTVILNPALNSATQALVLSLPPGSRLEQNPFDVIASGYILTGASSTVTIKLWSGTSTTVGSDTNLCTSGAVSAFSGKTPWYLRATMIYDSVSGKLIGGYEFCVNNAVVLVATSGLAAVITGVNNANNPVLNFVLSVAFGTGNAGNTINVKEFAIYEK